MRSASETSSFTYQNLSTQECLVILTKAIQDLGWNIHFINESGLKAVTSFSWKSWKETVRIYIHDHQVIISSTCTIFQVYDWGKNAENIHLIELKFNDLVEQISHYELMDQYYHLNIQTHPKYQEELQLINQEDSKNQSSSFSDYFKLSSQYFYTLIIPFFTIGVFFARRIVKATFQISEDDSLISWGSNYYTNTLNGEYWRLISANFLHLNFIHLFSNMLFLWFIGIKLEPHIGRTRFLSAYLLTALSSSVISLYFNINTIDLSIGASGAVFGMFGLFIAMYASKSNSYQISYPLIISVVLFLAISIIPDENASYNIGIDHAAHFGGLISGGLIGLFYFPSLQQQNSKKLLFGTIAILSIVFILLTTSLFYSSFKLNKVIYFEKMEEFSLNEKEAIQYLYSQPSNYSNEEFSNFYAQIGIPNFKRNLQILGEIQSLNLPKAYRIRNNLMIRYCKARIQSFQYLTQSFQDEQLDLDQELSELDRKIQQIFYDMSRIDFSE